MESRSHNMISVHHVGARGRSAELFAIPSFGSEFVYTFYDADDTAEVAVAAAQRHWKISRACIGRSERDRDFNIMHHGPSSSLLKGNPALNDFRSSFGGIDRPFAAERTIERVVKVDTRPLSADLCSELGVPPPDFLILDVQGAEGEILRSADAGIIDGLIGVVAEVHMAEIYEGALGFAEILAFLNERGFFFVGFTSETKFFPTSAPVGFRGGGFFWEGDALFLRNMGNPASRSNYIEHQKKKIKLAFISLLLKQIDFSLVCLKDVDWDADYINTAERPKYYELMLEIHSASRTPGIVFPPTLGSSFVLDLEVIASLARFLSPNNNPVHEILKKYGLDEAAEYYGEQAKNSAEHLLKSIRFT